MEMNVLIHDPYKSAAEIKAAGSEQVGDLDAALPAADFVSIHCPKTSGRSGCSMRRGEAHEGDGYLINTARGGIIDEPALYDALVSGSRRRGSRTCSSRSRRHQPFAVCASQCHHGPHVAGVTREAVDRMSEQTARNILTRLDGEPIRQNVINQDVLGDRQDCCKLPPMS